MYMMKRTKYTCNMFLFSLLHLAKWNWKHKNELYDFLFYEKITRVVFSYIDLACVLVVALCKIVFQGLDRNSCI